MICSSSKKRCKGNCRFDGTAKLGMMLRMLSVRLVVGMRGAAWRRESPNPDLAGRPVYGAPLHSFVPF